MATSLVVPMYAPDGTLGDVPYDQMSAALRAGGKLGVNMTAPDGTHGVVPAERVQEAAKAGGKIIPFDLSKAPAGEQHKGIWDTFADDVKSVFSGLWQGVKEGKPTYENTREGTAKALADMDAERKARQSADATRQKEGHGLAYRVGAGIAENVGTNVTGMEEAARTGNSDAVIGHMLAGQALAAAPLAVEGAGKVSSKVASGAADTIGTALRTETGKLKPGVRAVTALGKLVGAPEIADALIPDRPGSATMAERRAVPVSRNPTPGGYTGPVKAATEATSVPITQSPDYDPAAYKAGVAERTTGAGQPSTIVPPEAGASKVAVSEGRPATWTNERVIQLAAQGDRNAIAQAVRRGFMLPENVRYVMGDMDYASGVSNPKSVTKFSPTGEPIVQGAPMEEVAYRSRDVGEQGIPADVRSHAHATTDLGDLQRLAPGRESVTGKAQEFVKADLAKLEEGKDYVRVHRPGQADWIRFLRPLKESEIERVSPQ